MMNNLNLIKGAALILLFALFGFLAYNHGYDVGHNKSTIESNKIIKELKDKQQLALEQTLLEIEKQKSINSELSKLKQAQEEQHKKEKTKLYNELGKLKNEKQNKDWLSTPIPSDISNFLRNN